MDDAQSIGGSTNPDEIGPRPAEGSGEAGIPQAPVDENRAPHEGAGSQTAETQAAGENGDAGGREEDDFDKEDSGSDGAPEPAGRGKARRISRQTFRAACVAGEGNRTLIAAATGLGRDTVADRINADPELSQLYGDGRGDAPTRPPGEMSVLNRNPNDLPRSVAVEIGQVSREDTEQYYVALKAYGVSDERINKLKSLDGLAKNWATHVSISLRGHHQSYDGQLHNLAEVAENIKKRLDVGDLDAESYSYLAKVYVECVKEAGKGVGMMLTLTEALVRMIGAKNEVSPTKAVSGWGPMKKVRKAS